MSLFAEHVSSEPLRRGLLVRVGLLALKAKHYGASECLLLRLAAAEGDASLTAEKVSSDAAGRTVIRMPCQVVTTASCSLGIAAIWQAYGYWTV